MTNQNIALFFQDPEIEPAPPGAFGVLYLLRRDIKNCIINRQALWPGAMAILAGIDLLGKFLAGSDRSGQVRKRFRQFVNRYFQPVSADDAMTIYQLRNALLHSFGLYSEDKKSSKVYRFTLSPVAGPLIQVHPVRNDSYLINLLTLYRKFENAIALYQADLQADVDLRSRFNVMFPKYGEIHVYAAKVVVEASEEEPKMVLVVYVNYPTNAATIHSIGCYHFQKRRADRTKNGHWTVDRRFLGLEDARRYASSHSRMVRTCTRCLGTDHGTS